MQYGKEYHGSASTGNTIIKVGYSAATFKIYARGCSSRGSRGIKTPLCKRGMLAIFCRLPTLSLHGKERPMKTLHPARRLPLLAVALVIALSASAQQKQPLTIDNLSDPLLMQMFGTPRVWWLEDNTALVYDTRKPVPERTLEKLDPRTGKREVYLNTAQAEASLKSLFRDREAPRFSPVPASISPSGKYGLFSFEGDLFVLDIPAGSFLRITETPEAEKSANFSPDGRNIGFVRGNDLYVYDLSSGQEIRLTQDGSQTILNGTLSWVYWEEIFGRQDIGYWWSKDSKAIAFLRTDESEVSVQHYVNFEPWTPTVTTQRYPKVGEKNPAVRIGIVEIPSAQTTWAQIDPSAYEYIIRVDWLPDNRRVCVRTMNRLQTELDVYFVERATGRARFILKDTDEGWINMSDDLFFLQDGKHFLMSSERDGFEHLYRYTLDGKLVNQVTKGAWAIRSSGGGAFWVRRAVTGIDEKNGWVYFTALEKSPLERHLYRIRMDGSGMKRLTEGDGTHSITMSPDAQWYFDRYSSISTPPSLTLFDASGKKKNVLAEPNTAALQKFDIRFPELLSIPARDGFLLPGSILKPAVGEQARKYPVVVNVYGGPSAPTVSNSFGMDILWDNVLLNEGYLSAKVDNRAATGISKKLENLLVKRTPAEVELNDLVDGVRWLKQQPYADAERFGITGWSGGGTNTILGMTRSTEFKAGIAGAGVTDFRFYDTKWGEAAMKTEEQNLKGFEDVSLLKYAKDLHGKLMLVHGTHDDNVHIQNTWRFVDELVKANKLFELMIYPMRKHGVGDPAGRLHYRKVQMDFWKRNL